MSKLTALQTMPVVCPDCAEKWCTAWNRCSAQCAAYVRAARRAENARRAQEALEAEQARQAARCAQAQAWADQGWFSDLSTATEASHVLHRHISSSPLTEARQNVWYQGYRENQARIAQMLRLPQNLFTVPEGADFRDS